MQGMYPAFLHQGFCFFLIIIIIIIVVVSEPKKHILIPAALAVKRFSALFPEAWQTHQASSSSFLFFTHACSNPRFHFLRLPSYRPNP
jgi:hypothetical protein